jgi:hypothetical protein
MALPLEQLDDYSPGSTTPPHRAKTAVTAGLVSSIAFALVVEFGAVRILVDGDH